MSAPRCPDCGGYTYNPYNDWDMRYCTSCEKVFHQASVYCRHCGKLIGDPGQDLWYCRSCAWWNKGGAEEVPLEKIGV